MRVRLVFILALALLSGSGALCADKASFAFTVHGRLSFYNGTPSFRIWIVGTKRILGIRQNGNEQPDVPKDLRNLISLDRDVFGDFTVEPLTPSEPGVMQTVRVLSVSKIVLIEGNKIVLRKDKP
ncbi:MAG TPA: hypothetical protein VNZ64_05835 [Candidatus Acidoferrum sp.]|jgi:hypothetical protein|nr:hypothetical protein [Candidatus Acidoferrum sp.]